MKMRMKMACLVLLSLLFVFPFSHSSPSYQSDEEALLAFRHSLSIDSYNSLSDWSPNHSFCNWTGVACTSRHQRVVSLNLTGMSLLGPISPFLGNLSFLKVLALWNNSFHDHIPPQLGKLFRLRILRLSMNQLEGSIPSTLANCRSLQALKLSFNNLTGNIPLEFGLLSHLEILYLSENQLTGIIPPSLGNLSKLTELELLENMLQGSIPIELGMLTQLTVLALGTNKLIGMIPTNLSNCALLQTLVLYENKLHGGIPIELGKLNQLTGLYLQRNNLIGKIPISLSNCTLLQRLLLSENNLHGSIPSEYGMLTQLELLFLNENSLIGSIPVALSNCTLLQSWSLYMNQITGHIPLQLGKLSNLQNLFLDANQLTGEIPTSLSNCTQLQRIDFNSNQLGGTIPIDFGKLSQLLRIYLHENNLVSGSNKLSFITALTNCSNLNSLDLAGNNLSGILPSSISRLSIHLSYLALDSNELEGNIPSFTANYTNLRELDLNTNHFNGSIPPALGQLPNLEILHLEKNNLHGRIPKELSSAKRLGFLSLSQNMISGEIPESLGDLPQLRYLLLHHNQLSGKLPATLGRCITLEKMDLSHNKLEGNIPPEWTGLQNLQFYFNISNNFLQGSTAVMSKMAMVQAIDVSQNKFSGEISAAISSCKNLQYLSLSWNSLNGPIPTSIGDLKNIESIDLSRNNLSGAIPMTFQGLKTLSYINLSSNNLIGEVPNGGVFANISESAISGNPGLCGKRLNLQQCNNSKHKKFPIPKKIMVPTVIGIVIFIMSILIVVINMKHNKDGNTPDLNIGPTRISYEELVDATSGFSQLNLLGVGSFGSVYKGILHDGTIVAVKVLNSQDENILHSFYRECNVFKRVRHRNVIKIISACSSPSVKALILPFMSNGSLEKWLYNEGEDVCRLNLSDRLRIAKEIAQGMEYLHHYCFVQIVHSDLKPSNVLLGDDTTPFISDFGITKIFFGNSMDSSTSSNALKGSIGYIAPEYGMGGHVSTKGDVYSYGILVLELLTRRRPTDDMFVESCNLPKWVTMNFPNRIKEMVDNTLLKDVSEPDMSMVLACLSQFIQVGLACTRELPQQRPNMVEIVERLEKIISAFLGTPRKFHLPIDISPLLETTNGTRNSVEDFSTSTS